jgi:hypothetical protein
LIVAFEALDVVLMALADVEATGEAEDRLGEG